MKLTLAAAVLLVSGTLSQPTGAQQLAAYSSSIESPESAPASAIVATPPRISHQADSIESRRVLPFSRVAIGTRVGTLGWGGQIATPLTSRINLRGSAQFFNFGYGLGVDGANYNSELHLKSGTVSVDIYPFRSSFHVSPGFVIFKSTAAATMYVPGGNTFSLGDQDYTSDPNDPVQGNGALTFGRTILPAFTIGFGNMIPAREKSHWSVPIDIGAAYTGQNSMQINVGGSVCQQGFCMSTSDPSVQSNVVQEQNDVNESMKRFKIYPILTTGVTYRF